MSSVASALAALNTLLQFGDGESPETFVTVPNVSDLKGPSLSVTIVDVSSNSNTDRFRRKVATLIDSGMVTAKMFLIPSNPIHKQVLGFLQNGTVSNWRLVFPDSAGTIWNFPNSQVTKCGLSSAVAGVEEVDLEITIGGQTFFS
jgi:hypothetical protein